jgi:putative endonuclease
MVYGGCQPATPEQACDGGRGSSNMFYTYVLKSLKDKKLYVGFSEDLEKRIKSHNSGKVEATRLRRPFKLVYYEACLNKNQALKREKYFKTGFGRRYLRGRI